MVNKKDIKRAKETDGAVFVMNPDFFWGKIQGIDDYDLATSTKSNKNRANGYFYGVPVYVDYDLEKDYEIRLKEEIKNV